MADRYRKGEYKGRQSAYCPECLKRTVDLDNDVRSTERKFDVPELGTWVQGGVPASELCCSKKCRDAYIAKIRTANLDALFLSNLHAARQIKVMSRLEVMGALDERAADMVAEKPTPLRPKWSFRGRKGSRA